MRQVNAAAIAIVLTAQVSFGTQSAVLSAQGSPGAPSAAQAAAASETV